MKEDEKLNLGRFFLLNEEVEEEDSWSESLKLNALLNSFLEGDSVKLKEDEEGEPGLDFFLSLMNANEDAIVKCTTSTFFHDCSR